MNFFGGLLWRGHAAAGAEEFADAEFGDCLCFGFLLRTEIFYHPLAGGDNSTGNPDSTDTFFQNPLLVYSFL